MFRRHIPEPEIVYEGEEEAAAPEEDEDEEEEEEEGVRRMRHVHHIAPSSSER